MTRRPFPNVSILRASRRLLACTGAALALAAIAAGAAPAAIPAAPGGPILVVTANGDGFASYLPEILRGEGLNEFDVADIGSVGPQTLASHDVVVLGHTSLSDAQVAMFGAWVQGGGNLVAMRPDKKLAGLLGLADAGGTRDEGNLTSVAGGVTGASMRFHGSADLYGLAGASPVATLDSGQPAVTLRDVGGAGGQAAAFTYDLARSVVYTRQGNPAWAGTERDGNAEAIRSDDMFFGNTQPDWVDLNRVQVPAADEQQRMLANLIIGMENDRMPLPRFWYLPRGLKAAVVLTGDDHNYNLGGTNGQFNRYLADSPPGCSVALWQCVRSTSYLFPGISVSNAQAAAFQAQGFEIALHLWVSGNPAGQASGDGNCHNFPSTASVGQRPRRAARGVPHDLPEHRRAGDEPQPLHHLQRLVQRAARRARPTASAWTPTTTTGPRPGSRTAPACSPARASRMRFAETDGSLIDVYQATTQLTDESGQDVASEIRVLLDNAIGPAGFYGVFTANMHTDEPDSPGADAIIAAAQARGVPVVSARQMLTWLDGRNTSSFQGLSFSGGRLSFSVAQGAGATGLQGMLPASGPTGALQAHRPQRPAGGLRDADDQGHHLRDLPRGRRLLRRHLPRAAAGGGAGGGPGGASKQGGADQDRRGALAPHGGADLPAPEAQHPEAAAGRRALAGHHLPPEAHVARRPDLPHDQGQDRPPHPNAAALQGRDGAAPALGRARQQGPLRQARALRVHPHRDRLALPEDRPRIGARPRRDDLSLSRPGWRRRAPEPRWRPRCAAGSS